jgi:hypothetical protein
VSGGAPDAGDGAQGGRPRSEVQDDDARQLGGSARRPGEAGVRRDSAESAVGGRSDLCRDVEGVRLRRLRHRRVRTDDRGVASVELAANGSGARCTGAGAARASEQRPARASQRPWRTAWAQPVVATRPFWTKHRCSSSASAGVHQPSVLRGRVFNASATASRSSRRCR